MSEQRFDKTEKGFSAAGTELFAEVATMDCRKTADIPIIQVEIWMFGFNGLRSIAQFKRCGVPKRPDVDKGECVREPDHDRIWEIQPEWPFLACDHPGVLRSHVFFDMCLQQPCKHPISDEQPGLGIHIFTARVEIVRANERYLLVDYHRFSMQTQVGTPVHFLGFIPNDCIFGDQVRDFLLVAHSIQVRHEHRYVAGQWHKFIDLEFKFLEIGLFLLVR